MIETITLEPCPFCGSGATIQSTECKSNARAYWTVGCPNIMCRGCHGISAGPDRDKEIADWNTRPKKKARRA